MKINVQKNFGIYLSSYAILASAVASAIFFILTALAATPKSLIIEILKVFMTVTVTAISLGLVAITYAKGVLSKKYFGLESFELEGEISDYILSIIDFYHERVSPLISSLDEWKTIEAKLTKTKDNLEEGLADMQRNQFSTNCMSIALHQASNVLLMIETAFLFNTHREENPKEWSRVLEERNKLQEKHWPLVKRLSSYSEVRQIVSPRFLVIIILGIIELILAAGLVLCMLAISNLLFYGVFSVQSFLFFYVIAAVMLTIWKFLQW